MIKVLTAAQMQKMDQLTVERCAIPYAILMETAATRVVEAIERHCGDVAGKQVAIFCGKGNNGGDGAAIARLLWQKNAFVKVFLFGTVAATKGAANANFLAIQNIALQESQASPLFPRLTFEEIQDVFPTATSWKKNQLPQSDNFQPELIIDALFGTGITRPVTGIFQQAIQVINELKQAHPARIQVVAVDIPSGLPSDQNAPIGAHVDADLTVTFTAPKWSNVLAPNCQSNGTLVVASIGTPRAMITESSGASLQLLEETDIAHFLQQSRRTAHAHKNAVGDVLLIAGSRGKTGAAALCAHAILRTGAGLVTVGTAISAQSLLLQQLIPEAMTEGLPETLQGSIAQEALPLAQSLAANKTVLAIGPGLDSSDESTRAFVRTLIQRRTCPVIIDADGLNALAPWSNELKGTSQCPIIITPHPAEMARLTGKSKAEVVQHPVKTATEFAAQHHVITIIKGNRTIIAAPCTEDENDTQIVHSYINPTGNAGMATAGSGDVLTGIIASLVAQALQNRPPEASAEAVSREAALAGVYLHGLAGDLAAQQLGMRSLIASDLIHHIGPALLKVGGADEKPPQQIIHA